MGRYIFLVGLSLHLVWSQPEDINFKVAISSCNQSPSCKNSLKEAVADFTQSLYADMAKTSKQENFVFSPLSIHSALSLLYVGSTPGSETEKELADALSFLKSSILLQNSYKHLIDSYRDQASFLYGNSIWVQDRFNIAEKFKNEVRNNFGAGIQNIDFTRKNSVALVNDWISDQTTGLIPKLVQNFPSSTTMFLANALYFKDKWLVPFQEKNESGDPLDKELFYGDSKMKVPMMLTRNNQIGVGTINLGSNNATFISIPYISEQFEMQIFLPSDKAQGGGLAILEDYIMKNVKRDKFSPQHNLFLSEKHLNDNVEDVRLVMPKFSISTKFDASEVLKSLGVTHIFKDAELNQFGEGADITVSSVLHKAVVNVDNEGTEGAAATGVELVLLSGSFGENIDVNVNRPFIFVVHDKKNNIPVLVGRVKNPLV